MLEEQRYNFGYKVLGPVIHDYLSRLYTAIRFFQRTGKTKTLFMSRAGVRIYRLLEIYQQTYGLPVLQDTDYLWVSRLMIAKAVWPSLTGDANRLFEKEFSNASNADFVASMLRHLKKEEYEAALLPMQEQSIGSVASFLESNSLASQLVKDHFEEQSGLFDDYFSDLTDGYERVVFVDTGWQATTQRLFAKAYPDHEFWGLYFGRSGFADTDRSNWDAAIGLVFEADAFQPEHPETSIVLHRHIIESLFEPSGRSVESLERDDLGTVIAPQSEGILSDNPTKYSHPRYFGVVDYMRSAPSNRLSDVRVAAAGAWRGISRFIVHPTREDAALFSDLMRSADFGRSLKVPLLIDPGLVEQESEGGDNDSVEEYAKMGPEGRIANALWQAGQVALEYDPEMAKPVQRRLAGIGRTSLESKPAVERRAIKSDQPIVAVITRTLDRPTFLARALASVGAQTYRNYVHVVVCDGGDISEVAKTINNAPIDISKVQLVDNVENRGMEAASNFAIASSDSEYIVVHDDDDSWEPDFLRATVEFLENPENFRCGGVISKTNYVSEKVTPGGIEEIGRSPYMEWVNKIDLMEMAIGNIFAPISFLFRRSVYDEIGGFNENYPVLGDWDFNLQVLRNYDIGVVPTALANYHHRDVGDVQLFGNSVIADRDKHFKYSAIVRNNLVRDCMSTGDVAMAQLVGVGMHLGDLRGRLQEQGQVMGRLREGAVNANPGFPRASRPPEKLEQAADLYWRAFTSIDREVKIGSIGVLTQATKGLVKRILNKALGVFGVSFGYPPTRSVRALADQLSPAFIDRPDFDSDSYLERYPDVAEAIREGRVRSAYEHYLLTGMFEVREARYLDI